MATAWLTSLLLLAPVHAGIEFNGSNQSLNGSPPWTVGNAATICIWFFTNTTATNQAMVWVGDEGTTNNRYWIVINTSDAVAGRAQDAGAQNNPAATATFSTGQWEHACFAIEASGDNHTIYYNGGNSTTGITDIVPTGVDSIWIAREFHNGWWFPGSLAELAIWDTVLSSGTISDMFTNGLAANCVQTGNLIRYWKFTTSTDLTDSIAGQTLTANNSPTTSSSHPTLSYCDGGFLNWLLLSK